MKKNLVKLFRWLSRRGYLLSRLYGQKGKTMVVYTKWHPIYTSIFEDTPFEQYIFAYLNLQAPLKGLEKKLYKRAAIVHCDATAYKRGAFAGKKLVVECEGLPEQEMLSDPEVRTIYVESRAAAAPMGAWQPKMKLLYPAVPMAPERPARPAGPVVLTAVGYGGMVKGFDVVYRLYETLKRDHDIRLNLCGTFGHNYQYYPEITSEAYERAGFPAIEAALRADPNVRFGPVRREVLHSDIYPATDIYLHFSRMETFGYSIIEAMSHGLPVVATGVRAIPEMVANNQNGFLVNDFADDFNSPAWLEKSCNEGLAAVKRLIEDKALREQMGRISRERARNIFDIQIKQRKLRQDYDALMSGR